MILLKKFNLILIVIIIQFISIDTKNHHYNTNSNNFDNKNVNTNPIYNSSNEIYHDNNDNHINNNSNSNVNINDNDDDHDYIQRNYANLTKKGNNNSINYTTIDFNNSLSYISYPNYPIQLNNNNGINHYESFQNILHFQKYCNINDKKALVDLRKKYGPSHRLNSYSFYRSNNGKVNITFNEIPERFKKNCDEIEKTKVISSSNITSSKSTPYSSSNTNLIQTNFKIFPFHIQ